jgi:hypothetical protein
LIFLSRMIFAHRDVSLAMSAASSPGLQDAGTAPEAASLPRTESAASARRTAPFKTSMRSRGLPE